jgi:uncharacterized membrane protein
VKDTAVVPFDYRRILSAIRSVVTSPCTWLVVAAVAAYSAFAYVQYSSMASAVGACDLGIFYQAVQGWADHGWPHVPIKGYPQLGDHFSPIFILLAPLTWLSRSPFLLVETQVVLLCLSAVPVYLVFQRLHGRYVATAMTFAYLAGYAMMWTIAFPIHEVMFGVPILAWGLERALAGKYAASAVLIGLLVFVKEDMGAIVILFGGYLLLRRRWRLGAALIVWGAAWLVISIQLVLPTLNPGGLTYAGDYRQSLQADGIFEGIPHILAHPVDTAQILFDNPSKRRTWTYLLLPVGFLTLASPLGALMVPIMLTRMLSARHPQWSIRLYYDMPLMPILFIALADALRRITVMLRRHVPRENAPILAVAAATAAAVAAVHIGMRHPIPQILTGRIHFHEAAHLSQAQRAMAHVPANVTVRASNTVAVRLLATNTVTLIGSNVDRGDWAIMDTEEPGCPLAAADVSLVLKQLDDMGFRLVYRDGPYQVLHRVTSPSTNERGTGTRS